MNLRLGQWASIASAVLTSLVGISFFSRKIIQEYPNETANKFFTWMLIISSALTGLSKIGLYGYSWYKDYAVKAQNNKLSAKVPQIDTPNDLGQPIQEFGPKN